MNIPFYDLRRLNHSIGGELDGATTQVVSDAAFVRGPWVERFERALAGAHDLSSAVGCASGTDALALALRALGIGAGDEVVVPAMTFVATAEAVVHVGATPVFADVDEETLLLTATTVDEVISDRTKAIIPVHLYGNMVAPKDMQLWRDAGLIVLEDAAQAHLASFDGIGVGQIGHAACLSFFPGKNLGAFGDGGAVMSNESSVVERVRVLADHGRRSKYEHDVVGYCSRLDGLQAAVLDVKLKHLGAWTVARRNVASWYLEAFAQRGLPVSHVPFVAGSVHHLFVVFVEDRKSVQERLSADGIGTGVHYPIPLTRQPALRKFTRSDCRNSEHAAEHVLSLPMDPLLSREQVETVAAILQTALK